MTYIVKDRVAISVSFESNVLDLERNFVSLQISSGINMGLPMCRLIVTDETAFFKKEWTISDGNTFTINLGENQDNLKTYGFVIFAFKEGNVNGISSYVIDGYLAFPVYFNKSITEPRTGTSSNVIAKLAEDCGFASNLMTIDTTNDSQIWLPRNRRYNQFISEIAKSGYASDTSCMVVAISSKSEFKYIDLSRIVFDDVNDQQYVFGNNTADSIQIHDAKIVSDTGASNANGGYASMMIQQSSLTDTVNTATKVSLINMADTISSNSTIKNIVDKSKFVIGPIDCGNVHASSYKAKYQNQRIFSMYNNGIKILTPGISPDEITDSCVVKYDTPDATNDVASINMYSGRYIVKSKMIQISGSNVFTKLDLIRNGFNSDVSGVQS